MMDREWELRAACRAADPDTFFSSKSIGLARQLCQGCPVRMECLESALVREDGVAKAFRTGLVAGLTGAQRWAIGKQREVAAKAGAKPAKKKPRPKSTRRWNLAPCGTRAAYQRHVRKGEPVDDACRAANNAGKREHARSGTTQVPVTQ
ncbi:transcription factor WhiB [Streptomyces turgidiscabies Car8]|uniref:Transcription factor WhiB n=2 Tax=Streptomyces turgidiscabies TaxID=85558 RepID=L7EZI4_STRT8|nr:transcription factor WhiB [Streptomyces turgidiscabies Car8]